MSGSSKIIITGISLGVENDDCILQFDEHAFVCESDGWIFSLNWPIKAVIS